MVWSKQFSVRDIVLPSESQVRHEQWSFDYLNTVRINEDLFLNPDKASPIAGILVHRYGPVIQMYLVERPGKNAAATVAKHWHYQDESRVHSWESGGYKESLNYLAAFGLDKAARLPLFESSASVAPEYMRGAQVASGKKLVEVIGTTDLISSKPEVREAMINTMKAALTSMRHAAPTVIDHDGPQATPAH